MPEYLLHGPPGTGKTWTLANRWVPRAVEQHGEEGVLVASLTKTAASEVAGRMPLPREQVGTLHGHAFRALGSPGVAEEHHAAWNDRHPEWAIGKAGSAAEGDRGVALKGKPPGTVLLEEMGTLRARRVGRDSWSPNLRAFAQAYDAWKAEHELVDFTDMIERAIDEVPVAPGDPGMIVVDEAQDCSELELELVRNWAARADSLVLAGDSDQAIFEWRGASAEAFRDGSVPEENQRVLGKSRRVPREVHAVASRWIRRCTRRHATSYEPRDGSPGAVHRGIGSASMVGPLCDAVEADLEGGGTAMLLASAGYQLTKALKELRRRGVPYHNPYTNTNGAWSPMRGGVARLAAFLRPTLTISRALGQQPRLWNTRELHAWLDPIAATYLPHGLKKRVADDVQAQRKRTEVGPVTPEFGRELLGDELWEDLRATIAIADPSPERALAWYQQRVRSSKQGYMEFAFQVARSAKGLAGLVEQPRVVVGTIHSVKGGEADHVHLLPDLPPAAANAWLAGGEQADPIIRQFYVGITRSRETLTLHRQGSPFAVDL